MYLSHNITNNLIKLETALSKLHILSDDTKIKEKIQEEKLNYSIFFFTNSTGVELSLKDAVRVNKGNKLETKDFRGELVENFKNCLELIISIAENNDIPLTEEVLLQLNRSLGAGTVEEWKLKFRQPEEQFTNIYDDYLALVSEELRSANGATETSKIMAEFNQHNGLNRFYKLSYLLYQLLRLQPFLTYNKYTLILIAELITNRYTGEINNSINNTEFFIQRKNEINQTFVIHDLAQQEVAWHELYLEFCAKALDRSADAVKASIQVNPRSNRPFLDLNRRQLKILKYLQTIPTVKREDYVQMMDVSAMTAYRDLQVLQQHKLIRGIGVGRGTKYTLASR